jgi:large subunit ribosomal protein L15
MSLNIFQLPSGDRVKTKRIGRGIGSGYGKTSGRGHKGEKARSGTSNIKNEFESKKPYTSIPKRGFRLSSRALAKRNKIMSIDFNDINAMVELGVISNIISKDVLFESGVIDCMSMHVRLIGNGSPSTALKIELDHITSGAREIAEKNNCVIV